MAEHRSLADGSGEASSSAGARLTRRKVLATSVGAPGAFLLLLAGCSEKEFACDHAVGLPPESLAIRQNLAYQDRAPKPELTCDNCQQFVPAQDSEVCAGCKVMPGPTHPKGTCKVWAQKA
jgi:hypothetical protein